MRAKTAIKRSPPAHETFHVAHDKNNVVLGGPRCCPVYIDPLDGACINFSSLRVVYFIKHLHEHVLLLEKKKTCSVDVKKKTAKPINEITDENKKKMLPLGMANLSSRNRGSRMCARKTLFQGSCQ